MGNIQSEYHASLFCLVSFTIVLSYTFGKLQLYDKPLTLSFNQSHQSLSNPVIFPFCSPAISKLKHRMDELMQGRCAGIRKANERGVRFGHVISEGGRSAAEPTKTFGSCLQACDLIFDISRQQPPPPNLSSILRHHVRARRESGRYYRRRDLQQTASTR
jgi:hypothetical protein